VRNVLFNYGRASVSTEKKYTQYRCLVGVGECWRLAADGTHAGQSSSTSEVPGGSHDEVRCDGSLLCIYVGESRRSRCGARSQPSQPSRQCTPLRSILNKRPTATTTGHGSTQSTVPARSQVFSNPQTNELQTSFKHASDLWKHFPGWVSGERETPTESRKGVPLNGSDPSNKTMHRADESVGRVDPSGLTGVCSAIWLSASAIFTKPQVPCPAEAPWITLDARPTAAVGC
jgi:hypothetical protein